MMRLMPVLLSLGCVDGAMADKAPAHTGGRDSEDSTRDTDEDTGDDSGEDTAHDDTSETDTEDSGSSDTGCAKTWTASSVNLAGADGKLLGVCEGDLAATTVRGAGDVDGDGQDDVAMWAPESEPPVVYVVQHPVVGPESLADAEGWFVLKGSESVSVGTIVGVAPFQVPLSVGADMNSDGYSDLLVGTPFGVEDGGWTWVVQGPVVGEMDLLDASGSVYGTAGELSGGDVSWLGDMNGDGWEDMLIGATGLDVAESSQGSCATSDRDDYGDEGGRAAGGAYIVLGPVTGATPLSGSEARVLGEDGYDYAGSTLTKAGDLDGDGVPDLVISAFNNCESGVNAGAAYVLYGPVSGDELLSDADAKWMGESSDDNVGDSLAIAGDTNGDGWPDLLVGAPHRDSTGGSVYLISGPTYGKANVRDADAIFTAEAAGDYAGTSVDSAGDVNVDGFDDLLIGAYNVKVDGISGGATYVLLSPLTGSHDLADAPGSFTATEGQAGISVANLGDVDADGLTDLLIGAYGDSDAAEHAGAAYLLLGSGTFLSDVRASE